MAPLRGWPEVSPTMTDRFVWKLLLAALGTLLLMLAIDAGWGDSLLLRTVAKGLGLGPG